MNVGGHTSLPRTKDEDEWSAWVPRSARRTLHSALLAFGQTILMFVCFAGLGGCSRSPGSKSGPSATSAPPGPAWFEDVTARSGVRFVHDTGPSGGYRVPEQMGSGAAWFDYDGDGRLDLYLVQNGGPGSSSLNQLYHQEPDGRFRNVSSGSGLDVAGRGMGVAVGDVNNDGRPDVLLTEYGGVRLFVNRGDGRFVD